MKLDKEFVQKNLFWVLLIAALGLWSIGLVVVLLGPGAEVAKAKKSIEDEDKAHKNPGPIRNDSFNKPWDDRRKFYQGHKNTVWETAWVTQDGLMTWPERGDTTKYGNKDVYFGDPIDPIHVKSYVDTEYMTQYPRSDGKLDVKGFLGVYLPVDFNAAQILAPIDWSKTPSDSNVKQPSTEEVWLAQEEIWVRRELLKVLNEALTTIGKFTEERESEGDRSPGGLVAGGGGALDAVWRRTADKQRHRPLFKRRQLTPEENAAGIISVRKFKNYNWEVELIVEQAEGKVRISPNSKIKNRNEDGRALALENKSPRSDSAPVGVLLQLRQGAPDQVPVERTLDRIRGRVLQPGDVAAFKSPTSIDNIKFVDKDVDIQFDLVELFEPHTAPIRRLDDLRLGKAALAHRHHVVADLLPGRFPAPPQQPGGAPQQPQPGGGQVGGFGMGGGAPVGGGVPGQGQQSKQDNTLTPYGLEKNRYVLVTETVRRLPVAMVLSVDQSQRNAVLTAIANSRLRIQTTQVYWRHREPVQGVLRDDRPPDAGGPGPGPGPAGDPMNKGGADGGAAGGDGGLPESGRNLIELTIHGIAGLFERYPPRPPTNPQQPGFPPN